MDQGQMSAVSQRVDRLVRMLDLDPTNEALRRQAVDAAVAAGRFDTVAQLSEFVLTTNPSDSRALFDKATALMGRSDYRTALSVLNAIDAASAAFPAARTNVALCHYCLGEFDRAVSMLKPLYLEGQKDAGLLRLLVSAYHHLGRIDEASEVASDNASMAQADGALAGVYALLYLDAGDVVRASQWAKTALRLNPRSVDGRVTEAALLIGRMETARAKQMLEGVVQDAPGTSRAWLELGTLALLEHRFEQARQHLSKAADTIPRDPSALHVLGWAELFSGKAEAAERVFREATEIDPQFAEPYGGLAALAVLGGSDERAQHYLDKALELDPQCFSATYAAAFQKSRKGNPDAAQDIIVEAIGGLTVLQDSALSRILLKGNGLRRRVN